MPPVGHQSLEDRIQQWLSQRAGATNYQTRLRGKIEHRIEAGALVIESANPFLLEMLQARHASLLNDLAGEIVGPRAQVVFRTVPQVDSPRPHDANEPSQTPVMPSAKHASTPVAANPLPARRRYMDFADFIVGDSNQLAFTAAKQVAAAPGSRLNPLVIHGGVGLGKTHLLEGIVHEIRARYPALQTLLVPAEGFVNHFTEAMKSHTLASFRQRFRKVDVLLVDDIEFLCGKRASAEEFLNTMKKLGEEGCQMVFAADCHPRMLQGMGDDVISRLMAGMVCKVESPDPITRRAIAARLAERAGFSLSDEILDEIVKKFSKNVREIQGAINSLYAHALLPGEKTSVHSARQILSQFEGSNRPCIKLTDVEHAVCTLFRVTPQALRSGERKHTVCHARHLAIYLSRRLTGAAFSEIGSHFGNRNHSTIITSNDKIKSMIANHGSIKLGGNTWLVEDLVQSLEQQILAS